MAEKPDLSQYGEGAIKGGVPQWVPVEKPESDTAADGTKKKDIEAAFKMFDVDNDGTVTAKELHDILTREGGGQPLSEADAQEMIGYFDVNGDGKLNMKEFIEAWSAFGESVSASATYQNDLYDRRVKPHAADIKETFMMIDTDKSGYIEMAEIKEIMTIINAGIGMEFNEKEFLAWYDSNGSDPDGKFDTREFGWYAVVHHPHLLLACHVTGTPRRISDPYLRSLSQLPLTEALLTSVHTGWQADC